MGKPTGPAELMRGLSGSTIIAADLNNLYPAFPNIDSVALVQWLASMPRLESMFVFAGECKKRRNEIDAMRKIDEEALPFHYEFHSKKPVRKTIGGHKVNRADLDTTLVARTVERVVRGFYDDTRDEIDNLFLVSGDGDYVSLLDTVRSNGVRRIAVAGPKNSMSGELSRKADFTILLDGRFTGFINRFKTKKKRNNRKKKKLKEGRARR